MHSFSLSSKIFYFSLSFLSFNTLWCWYRLLARFAILLCILYLCLDTDLEVNCGWNVHCSISLSIFYFSSSSKFLLGLVKLSKSRGGGFTGSAMFWWTDLLILFFDMFVKGANVHSLSSFIFFNSSSFSWSLFLNLVSSSSLLAFNFLPGWYGWSSETLILGLKVH